MDEPTSTSADDSGPPNQEILARIAPSGWFRAKKTRPIFVKQVERAQTVQTLEGSEQVQAGDFLCRGETGLPWPQTAERLRTAYVATNEVDDAGWRRYDPNPDSQGVLAAELPQPCAIHTKWGTLTGKAGDYLVKNYEDRDVPYPGDVWIVDRSVFESTYRRIGNGTKGD
jgi:hypothetical protein